MGGRKAVGGFVSFLFGAFLLIFFCGFSRADEKYVPPVSPRTTYNFNPDWKFIKEDAPGAENPLFDDSKWTVVSAPHTYNDVDSFDENNRARRRKDFIHGTGVLSQTFQAARRSRGQKSFPRV